MRTTPAAGKTVRSPPGRTKFRPRWSGRDAGGVIRRAVVELPAHATQSRGGGHRGEPGRGPPAADRLAHHDPVPRGLQQQLPRLGVEGVASRAEDEAVHADPRAAAHALHVERARRDLRHVRPCRRSGPRCADRGRNRRDGSAACGRCSRRAAPGSSAPQPHAPPRDLALSFTVKVLSEGKMRGAAAGARRHEKRREQHEYEGQAHGAAVSQSRVPRAGWRIARRYARGARGPASRRDQARGGRDRQRGQHRPPARRRRGGGDQPRGRPRRAARVPRARADRPGRGGGDHGRRHAVALRDPRGHDGAGRPHLGGDHPAGHGVHAREGRRAGLPLARAGGVRHRRGRLPARARPPS